MATQNQRDVSLRILVETLGQSNVDKLREALDALAREGAAAAPEFQALTAEIDRLSQQAEAVNVVRSLTDEVGQLATQEAQATSAVEQATSALREQRTAVAAAQQAQTEARAALAQQQQALRETNTELKLLRAEYDAAGKKTQEFRDRQRELILQQGTLKSGIDAQREALRQSNAAVGEAEAAQSRLEKAQQRAAAAAEKSNSELTRQQRALDDARAAAAGLDITITDLAAAEAALGRGLTGATEAAQARAAALRDMAEADRLLAIEERTMAELLARGQAALRAEETALYEASRAAREYAAAKQEAAARADEWQREAAAIVDAAEAAQRLRRETEVLAAAQEELGRQRVFEQQAADAQKLVQAANYVRFWEDALQSAENEARQAAQAAEDSARRIANAYQTVGVRSVAELRDQIAAVRAAMATLSATAGTSGAALQGAFNAGNARIAELEREIRRVTGELTLADRAADAFKNSLGQIAAGNIIADGVGYLVNKVKELGVAFIDVTLRTERTRKGLEAVYKNAATAAQQFDFLTRTANAAGVSVGGINDAFLRFSASTKGANLPLQVTNELFANLTRAGATLGLSADAVTGALDALGQMASKGTVSMEELRQQLGDRLPGALGLAAQGLGITEAQLIKLVESGKLATEDFFPALSRGLATMAGDTDTLTGAWQRFTNMLTAFSQAVGDAGGLEVLKGAVQALGVAVGVVAVPLQGFVEALGLAGKAIGLFLGALTTGDFKGAFAAFNEEIDKSATRIRRFHAAIDGALSGTPQQTAALGQQTAALSRSTSALAANAAAQEKNNAAVAGASGGYIQQLTKLAETATATEAAVVASEKLAKAKQDEGKAMQATAQISGDAFAQLQAVERATAANAAASASVVEARQREVNTTQALIAAIQSQTDSEGNLSAAKQQQLKDAQNLLTTQSASLEQARQQTQELNTQAVAARANAEAYADNATKVDAYRQAMLNSREVAKLLQDQVTQQTAALAELQDKLETGGVTQEFYNQKKQQLIALTAEANQATNNAALNENRYRDAVADSIAALDRKTRAQTAAINVTAAQATADQRHYEALAAIARAQGNEAQATEFLVLAKYREIEATRQKIRVAELELQAAEAQIAIERAAVAANDPLREAKLAELDIRLKIIEAKRIELGTSREQISALEAEAIALRNRNSAQTQATAGVEANTSALDKNNAALQKNIGLTQEQQQNLQRGRTADGYGIDKNGNKVVAGGDLNTRTGIVNFLRASGVDDEKVARDIANQYADKNGQVQFFNNPGMRRYGGDTISDSLRRAAETYTFSDARRKRTEQPVAPGVPGAAPAPAPVSARTININLNGRPYPINVADDSSEQNLNSLLNDLQRAAGTAQ